MNKGTHGTSAENAKAIRVSGFKAGSGRNGSGVYFWAESAYSFNLAKAWFLQCHKEGKYGVESVGAVIYVTIRVAENEILNLEEPDIANRISIIINSKGISYWTEKKLAGLWDGFIKEMEAKIKCSFGVLVTRLAPPDDRYFKYPIWLLGAPFCYVVRNRSCIKRDILIEEIRQ